MTRDAVELRLPLPPVPFARRHGLSEAGRLQALGLLGRRLTDCLELRSLVRRLKADLRGSPAIGLRRELNEIEADVVDYADLLAGRVVQLGWAGGEDIELMRMRSTVVETRPVFPADGEPGASLPAVIAELARTMRGGSEELGRLGDADSAGLLAEVSRVAGTWLWRLEIPDGHAPAGRAPHTRHREVRSCVSRLQEN